ncbi:MAG: hypothetical protein R2880_10085 [Deinococcales bacterium]
MIPALRNLALFIANFLVVLMLYLFGFIILALSGGDCTLDDPTWRYHLPYVCCLLALILWPLLAYLIAIPKTRFANLSLVLTTLSTVAYWLWWLSVRLSC